MSGRKSKLRSQGSMSATQANKSLRLHAHTHVSLYSIHVNANKCLKTFNTIFKQSFLKLCLPMFNFYSINITFDINVHVTYVLKALGNCIVMKVYYSKILIIRWVLVKDFETKIK